MGVRGMSKSLRLSEKWFRRGLWLVAVVFASFLIGLGGTIVGDLPKVEAPLQLDDFLDKPAAEQLRAQLKDLRQSEQDAQTALEQARLQRSKARSESQAERETFNNWLAARSVTQRAEHDPEVLARTQALDQLKQAERKAQKAVEAQQQARTEARLECFAIAAIKLADGFEAQGGKSGNLLVRQPQGGDREAGQRSGGIALENGPGREMRQRPGGADGVGDCPSRGKTQLFEPGEQPSQHRRLAAEEMRHPGNVEDEIAIGGLVGEQGDHGTCIGMPIGEIGEGRSQSRPVDFAHQQVRHERTGIGKALADEEAGVLGRRVQLDQPHGALLLFVERQGWRYRR